MTPLKISSLGVVLGLAGYAAMALIFWYGGLSPVFAIGAIVVGVISLIVAAVSAIAAVVVLIGKVADKFDRWAGYHG